MLTVFHVFYLKKNYILPNPEDEDMLINFTRVIASRDVCMVREFESWHAIKPPPKSAPIKTDADQLMSVASPSTTLSVFSDNRHFDRQALASSRVRYLGMPSSSSVMLFVMCFLCYLLIVS